MASYKVRAGVLIAIILLGFAIFLFQRRGTSERSTKHPSRGQWEENKSSADSFHTKGGGQTNVANKPSANPLIQPTGINAPPIPIVAETLTAPTPVPGKATVDVGGKTVTPKNNNGHFERILLKPDQTIPIRLSWPDDTTHSGVFVQAVHGGKIDSGGNSKAIAFDANRSISFSFTPASGPGTYEIVLRRGTTEEALQFWVSTGNPKADPPTLR